jgi:lipoprotein-releasing system permease protein
MVLPGAPGALADPDAAAARIAALPGVTRAAPMVEGRVMASGPRGAAGVLVRAYRPDDLRSLSALAAPEEATGGLDAIEGRIAIGAGLATTLGVTVGDRVTLISPDGLSTPFGRSVKSRGYEVAYVFRVGMHEYDQVLVYMPLAQAQVFLNRDAVDGVEVMSPTPTRWRASSARCATRSARRSGSGPGSRPTAASSTPCGSSATSCS